MNVVRGDDAGAVTRGGDDFHLAAQHFQALAHADQSDASTAGAVNMGRYVETQAIVSDSDGEVVLPVFEENSDAACVSVFDGVVQN